jgi:hypothetical protein
VPPWPPFWFNRRRWWPSGSGSGGGHGDGQRLAAKAAGNKSANGRMMACDDKSVRQTTTQQPTNNAITKKIYLCNQKLFPAATNKRHNGTTGLIGKYQLKLFLPQPKN